MRNDNIEMLHDTLRILNQGSYKKDGRDVELKLSKKAMETVMETVHVLLPENVQDICSRTDFQKACVNGRNVFHGRCGHGCENMDSFAAI